MLKIEHVSKKFKNKEVLKDINFSIEKGELIYLYGKNGSGKSTLLKMICDILEPTQGKITIAENTIIGALIENPGYIELESMKFNLKYLASLTRRYDEDKIGKLCEYFELDINDKSSMKTYSVGMRQKVGIIQAIMEDQNLILFDEPTRGLDTDSINKFQKIVKELVLSGKSVVIASHDMMEELNFSIIYKLENGVLYKE